MEHRYEREYGCLILRMPRELDHHQAADTELSGTQPGF